MQTALYEFLVLNKKISLPGIGTISLQRTSSNLDFTIRQIIPPKFLYSLDSRKDSPSKELFEWLSSSLKISEWEAIKAVNDFSQSFKNELAEKKQVSWNNIGVFKKDGAGNLKLVADTLVAQTEKPVVAEKVIRERAEHTILVGEKERSVVEMEEYFAEATQKRNYAWVIAIVLVVLSVMFIGWYFSEKGFRPSSAGNNSISRPN